ncbi:MAG: ribonuclease J [Anaerolineae bacterium]|nr:MAG: ribonuclease J [Anaerolineae bacterium]
MNNEILRIIPIGGLGEIGKNMTAIEYGEDILVIDTGIMFPENDMLGIDYIIPDFQYLLERRDRVRAIVITHGHEDHTGALPHVLQDINVPIYATRLTRGLLEVKLARRGMSGMADLHTVNAGDVIKAGPFSVEFFHVCHSIPDATGVAIETPAGLIVHSGDYKFDPTPVDGWPPDYAKLGELAGRGVLALLADSTNADKAGWTPSERVIEPAFEQVFREAPGRILVATFASLISRMQQVANVTQRMGRKMAFVGTSMRENAKMARKMGYLDIPDDLVVSVDQALKMPPSHVVLMCTGSQGEPSSIMGRLSTGRNRQFQIEEGDTVILSSHPIPGNEETVYRTINRLLQRGAEVIYDPIAPVHVSGHASQEEMKLLIQLLRPKYLIPVHGELRHLRMHRNLAVQLGMSPENVAVVENGQTIEFVNGEMRLGERIPGGYVFVDGSGVGDIVPSVVRDRERLADDGVVIVNLVVDKFTGDLVGEPLIRTKGFVYEREAGDLLDGAEREIRKALTRNLNGKMERHLEDRLRGFFYSETQRRPVLFVNVQKV